MDYDVLNKNNYLGKIILLCFNFTFFFLCNVRMSPSLLQLQATGLEDVYLTQDPQINIFKYNYYRYVNFATETIKLETNIISNFGKKMTCEIPKRGHLLSKLHLHIKFSEC